MSAHFSTRSTGQTPTFTAAVVRAAVVAREMASALLEQVMEWRERRCQRRQLMSLDDHLLKDIGITRIEAYAEGNKPFWLT